MHPYAPLALGGLASRGAVLTHVCLCTTDITNFHNYVMPFPNVYVLGPNIKYFVEHGVVGLYDEGNGHGPGSDLDALKAYVTQSMMWDPDADDKALITDFLNFYYGKAAAPFVRLYIDIMHRDGAYWTGAGLQLSKFTKSRTH